MFLGVFFAILVAIFWSLGEVEYYKFSKNVDRPNVYFYQYFVRAVMYMLVVVVCSFKLIGTFNFDSFITFFPVIMCDFTASYVLNIAVKNGKLSVVSPIMAAYPIMDILLSIILLHESISAFELILVVIISLSIVILASNQKNNDKSLHPFKGIFFSIIYMLLIAFSIYFEKNAYISNLSMFDLYYYKSIVYFVGSMFFLSIIGFTPAKLKRINWSIVKGSCLTPVGNIFNSIALNIGNMAIVTPISSMYSVITNIISRKVLKEKIALKESICIFFILMCTIMLIILGIL